VALQYQVLRLATGVSAEAVGGRVAIAAYLGKGYSFDTAIADFSFAYADQNEQDYEALARAVKSGRLPAETGL
jgi:hypothetical protein